MSRLPVEGFIFAVIDRLETHFTGKVRFGILIVVKHLQIFEFIGVMRCKPVVAEILKSGIQRGIFVYKSKDGVSVGVTGDELRIGSCCVSGSSLSHSCPDI